MASTDLFSSVEQTLQECLPEIVDLRHDIHSWPEPGYEEEATSQKVVSRLEKLPGIQIQTGLAKTGVVAVLNPDASGPCLALRADMDCLPMEDTTGKPWASRRPGFAHACGHDGHTACLVGTAEVLSRYQDQLPGPVKFIFQPAEEGGGGGKAMIEDGALDQPRVDAIFGLHGFPGFPVGTYGIRNGPIMAAGNVIDITIHGRGSHAAMPHLGRDPILAGSQIISALQSLASRRTSPLDSCVVTIAKFAGGNTYNVIPDSVHMLGTIRTLQNATRERIHEEAKHLIHSVAQGMGCRAEVEIQPGYPVCSNAPEAADYFRSIFQQELASHATLEETAPIMAAEDFAFYGQKVPSTFFFLGVCPPGEMNPAQLHQNHYDFNDEAIPHAMRAFCALALNFKHFPKTS